jgi:hypothetical protein
MPTRDEIIRKATNHISPDGKPVHGVPLDEIRINFLKMLSQKTGRNTIAYYSGWLYTDAELSDVNDLDMTGFMKAMKDLDGEKGLDLILHTPGGDPTAAEGIVSYLQSKFNGDIRVIVPHMAMSAGTLISCAAKSILMGKHSFLGPVDAQVGGLGLLNAIKEFEDAREDMMLHPETANYWSIRLSKYPRSFYYYAKDGIALGDELLSKWLKNYMFAGESDNETKKKINRIKNKLNSNNKSHGRHFSFQDCVDMGLKVEALEDDSELQDLVLSVHHAFDITLANFPCAKIIENQLGANYEVNVAPQQ